MLPPSRTVNVVPRAIFAVGGDLPAQQLHRPFRDRQAVGIPEYWLIDLIAEKLEVYRDPRRTSYSSKAVLIRGDMVTPLNAADSPIAVTDLLP